jgi:hypothetical protein
MPPLLLLLLVLLMLLWPCCCAPHPPPPPAVCTGLHTWHSCQLLCTTCFKLQLLWRHMGTPWLLLLMMTTALVLC